MNQYTVATTTHLTAYELAQIVAAYISKRDHRGVPVRYTVGQGIMVNGLPEGHIYVE